MVTRLKFATMLALAVALGVVLAIYEPHRHFLAWAWPYITAYYDYLTA